MTIDITRIDDHWQLNCRIEIARPREEVFAFFSDARNLEALTPASLGFVIVTPEAELVMRAGLLIDYRLRLRGVPVRWRSEITEWEPPARFVDQQRRGPYRLWHHEHRFVELSPQRTEVIDTVRYQLPLDATVGRVVHRLFVKRELNRIFAFRSEVLRQRFGNA
jgi:ligand-binding SRPBCC domain-containing protein